MHGGADSVQQWWHKLRKSMGESSKTLAGSYILWHLQATELGSRSKYLIGEMKRWLGHSASSRIVGHYLKPVSPENRPTVDWVRKALKAGKVDV